MRILLLNWRDPTHPQAGGAEGYLLQIAKKWVAAGHRVLWLCGRHPGQGAEDELDGIAIRRRGGGGYGVFPAAAAEALLRIRGDVDVIVDAENGIPFFSPLYSKAPKIALVHHVHREVFARELPTPLAQIGAFLEGRVMPWLYRRQWFVTVSESTRLEVQGLGVSADRMAVIHNGLDHGLYKPGTKAERPTVAWIGRLRGYKNVDTLIEAAVLLVKLEPELRFVIAGEGPERSRLEGRIDDLGLRGAVEIRGFVDTAEKVRLLQRAHVAVQTSMKEGWGMTVIEANACGTAVVASDVPGLRDSVCHGETGLLVPWRQPEALADAVARLLRHPEARLDYESAAVEWARRFDWDSTADRWLEILSARLDAGSGGVPHRLRFDFPSEAPDDGDALD
ncbi:MAG: glycosyltransferase family 4 protein [Acidobacteriota bacterium]